ncbi:MAG: retropepsin-like aspartic protease [bacterium]|nr:retropepsin-like aspartic protease [bacterium]MDZ4284953.1 retropepsin-like aspartic protease [Patescibacteria group bacterium]
MTVEFPFEKSHSPVLGDVWRPVAQVFFRARNADLWREVWMIVDSGADYTLLPRYMAEHLGVNVEHDCKIFYTSGIGGTEKVYFLPKIDAQLGDFERTVPVGFIDRNEVPPLLGRHLFMETLETYFSSKHRTHFSDKPLRV